MKFVTHSYKDALVIINGMPEYFALYEEVIAVIGEITELELQEHFRTNYEGRKKSLSLSINALIDQKLRARGWEEQSRIFGESGYGKERRWRLDFSKSVLIEDNSLPNQTQYKESGMAVEVAFNHAEAIAWNLLKPTLAAQQNHVKKAIQAGVGIIITATDDLKYAGEFDSAVGSYQKFLTYMRPLSNVLTSPLLIIGLEAPESFHLRPEKIGKNIYGMVEAGPKPPKPKRSRRAQ